MKHNRLVCTIAVLLVTLTAKAQVPNSGFEEMNADDHISYWGKALLMAVIIDSNGQSTGDSIVFDNYLYFETPEAHSGLQAMEMRNAYNYTSNQPISGGSFLSANPEDSYSTGFQQLVEITPVLPPERLSFYYQFLPVGTDTAMVTLTLHDFDGIPIGEATAYFGQTTNGYTLADIPVVYSQPGTVYYILMSFSTSTPGGSVNFGTRFLVDDISLEGVLGVEETAAASVEVYPNPANETIRFQSPEPVEEVTVVSASGQQIPVTLTANTIDCSQWAPGIYRIRATIAGQSFSKKITIMP